MEINWTNFAIVIFMYIFSLALITMIIGTLSAYVDLSKYISARTMNILIVATIAVLYVLLVVIFLNDWAQEMIYSRSVRW